MSFREQYSPLACEPAEIPNKHGPWLTGRLGLVTLSEVVAEICAGFGVSIDVSAINGIVRGYLINNIMSPRSALGPLTQLYFFDACETNALIKFVQRGCSAVATYSIDQLIDSGNDSKGVYSLTRATQALASLEDILVLAGGNTCAIQKADLDG
jgi:hypothetical protein